MSEKIDKGTLYDMACINNLGEDLKLESVISMIDELKKIHVPEGTKLFRYPWIKLRTRKDEVNLSERILDEHRDVKIHKVVVK